MFGGSSAARGAATSANLAPVSRGGAFVGAAFPVDFVLAPDRRALSDTVFFVVFPLATAFFDAFFFDPPLVDFFVLARRADFMVPPLRNHTVAA